MRRFANLALALASFYIAFLVVDLVLLARPLPTPAQRRERQQRRAVEAMGRSFDARNRLEVVDSLQRTAPAWPAAVNQLVRRGGGPAVRDSFLPLGGIANVTSVLCNELGIWETFVSDRYGFRNPPDVWDRPTEVALVGDSFVQGMCVPIEVGFPGRVREAIPGTVALGGAGNGPLLALGLIREYLEVRRPRAVLWMYYEANDLIDLGDEARGALLPRYLDPAFRQGLVGRQAAIDSALAVVFTADAERERARQGARSGHGALWHAWAALKLYHVRATVRTLRTQGATPPCCDLPLFERVLARGDTSVRAAGGELLFVYIPSAWSLAENQGRVAPQVAARDTVLAIVRRLGIPVIDLGPAARERGVDPTTLYPFADAHFSAEGNRVVGDILLDSLQARGIPAPATASMPRAASQGAR